MPRLTSAAARRLGPLPGAAIALLLVVLVLPSALNIPQSNPTTTPEFAPVPPQERKDQLAAPRLSARSLSQGFHAIPAVPSSSPRVPACFYLQGDYTCVKDAVAEWWDPAGQDPNYPNPGCLRMPLGGRRFLARDWSKGDAESMKGSSDPCSGE